MAMGPGAVKAGGQRPSCNRWPCGEILVDDRECAETMMARDLE